MAYSNYKKYKPKYKTYCGLEDKFIEFHCFMLSKKADVREFKKGRYVIMPHDDYNPIMFFFPNTNTIYFKGNNTLYKKGLDLIYHNLKIEKKTSKNDLT